MGTSTSETAYADALAFCARLRAALDALLATHDVLLLPTQPHRFHCPDARWLLISNYKNKHV